MSFINWKEADIAINTSANLLQYNIKLYNELLLWYKEERGNTNSIKTKSLQEWLIKGIIPIRYTILYFFQRINDISKNIYYSITDQNLINKYYQTINLLLGCKTTNNFFLNGLKLILKYSQNNILKIKNAIKEFEEWCLKSRLYLLKLKEKYELIFNYLESNFESKFLINHFDNEYKIIFDEINL